MRNKILQQTTANNSIYINISTCDKRYDWLGQHCLLVLGMLSSILFLFLWPLLVFAELAGSSSLLTVSVNGIREAPGYASAWLVSELISSLECGLWSEQNIFKWKCGSTLTKCTCNSKHQEVRCYFSSTEWAVSKWYFVLKVWKQLLDKHSKVTLNAYRWKPLAILM